MTQISPESIHATFLDCLYKDSEVIDGKAPEGTVIAEGIIHRVGFHPQRLESHRQEIRQCLELLPAAFRKEGGGGWSTLNACFQEDGYQWTGEHRTVDELFTLGIALGLAEWLLPRDMWEVFPGGMPYAVLNLETK